MPSAPRPGKKGLYVELPEELDTAFRSYCEGRGVKIADELRLAIRRHMANPPPISEPPPLPPLAPPEPVPKKVGKKR